MIIKQILCSHDTESSHDIFTITSLPIIKVHMGMKFYPFARLFNKLLNKSYMKFSNRQNPIGGSKQIDIREHLHQEIRSFSVR